mmetsp:Transcript_122842/g.352811  ORF Transcript_122842/g.352811 Transcript_122842/m.352811 type:complete len:246 (-) Transcript_122842:668-1405(-)
MPWAAVTMGATATLSRTQVSRRRGRRSGSTCATGSSRRRTKTSCQSQVAKTTTRPTAIASRTRGRRDGRGRWRRLCAACSSRTTARVCPSPGRVTTSGSPPPRCPPACRRRGRTMGSSSTGRSLPRDLGFSSTPKMMMMMMPSTSSLPFSGRAWSKAPTRICDPRSAPRPPPPPATPPSPPPRGPRCPRRRRLATRRPPPRPRGGCAASPSPARPTSAASRSLAPRTSPSSRHPRRAADGAQCEG